MKHEANLVFKIGTVLMQQGIPFELEWASPVGRLDISIKTDEVLYGIIEVKHVPTEGTFQLRRYNSLGVPVVVVHWGSDLCEILSMSKDWIERSGVPILGLGEIRGIVKRYRKKKKAKMEWDEDLNIRE